MDANFLQLQDARGRTALFHAVETGSLPFVEAVVFAFPGTGTCPQRLGFIEHADHAGQTAIDWARALGHSTIAAFLEAEKCRMEYFG